jgi:RNA polymerase sigma-70 factor, ECF subfamily
VCGVPDEAGVVELTSVDERDPVAELFQRSGGAAYRLALAITGDAAAAEDVVQEAFMRVMRKGEVEGDLDAYLHRTTRNAALDLLRRKKVAAAKESDVALLVRARGPTPPAGLDALAVSQALLDLPVDQREVVALRVWEGLTFPEIAARTEAPLGTVHSRFRYAMERLRVVFGGSR